MDSNNLRELLAAVLDSGRVTILTGAGVSAESGIPTFRGPEGYWTVGSKEYHPQELATLSSFSRYPREVWRWYLYRRGVCRRAQPNPAHQAIAALETRLGDRFRLITQNVDGLHRLAGNSDERTYEIHGSIDWMRCLQGCSELVPMTGAMQITARDDPLDDRLYDSLGCPRCRSRTRPHVLWFDEYYNEELFRADSALEAVAQSDLLVIVGTSGSTTLPVRCAHLANQSGTPILEVNPEESYFSSLASWIVRGPAAAELPRLLGSATR